MNVWIDLGHIPQYNFYRNLIKRLSNEGYLVYLTVLKRGKLPIIVEKEIGHLKNVKIFVIGQHKTNILSAIIDANLIRLIKLFHWARGKKIDVALSNIYQSAWVGKILGFPAYIFTDDIRLLVYKYLPYVANEFNYCIYKKPLNYKLAKGANVLSCLKEWAYLAPDVFTPDSSVLKDYNLQPKEYFFLREVSVGTVNYSGQTGGALMDVQNLIPSDKKVIFSLEDKSKRYLYPKDWILLREPVKDIHSLIYFSIALVSSGDSMAREATLLGVPSYYLGIRYDMPANMAASEVGSLNSTNSMSFEDWINSVSCSVNELINNQQLVRSSINSKFIDINSYLYNIVKNNSEKNK